MVNRKVVVIVAVAALAAGAVLLSRPREKAVPAAVNTALAPASAVPAPAPALEPKPAAQRPTAIAAILPSPVETPRPRARSPLEQSPGYYPPADPESMSVITGRRDAPLVEFEFHGGAPTADDLAIRLLAALRAGDAKSLHELRISRDEFEKILWPELPESRPITNITADDAWDAANLRSISSADRAISGYGGRTIEFLKVEASAVVPYKNFTLHRGILITARDNASGEVFSMNFASSFIERRGQFKVVLYRD